jgi:hypothetical protein
LENQSAASITRVSFDKFKIGGCMSSMQYQLGIKAEERERERRESGW